MGVGQNSRPREADAMTYGPDDMDDPDAFNAAQRENVREHPGVARRKAEGWPEPIDFLAEAEMTGVPELRAEHLPEALHPFVADTAARMGVDPAAVALTALASLASVM